MVSAGPRGTQVVAREEDGCPCGGPQNWRNLWRRKNPQPLSGRRTEMVTRGGYHSVAEKKSNQVKSTSSKLCFQRKKSPMSAPNLVVEMVDSCRRPNSNMPSVKTMKYKLGLL